jgi:LmbE family N-acetylglucosaminyl deacetylase/SAM-dependent methyltransferase
VVTFDSSEKPSDIADWRDVIEAAPEFDLGAYESVVVVAPHPDDETLGAGGLIAACGERGIRVRVVVVTDGSGSHPGSATTPGELALLRAAEVTQAVALLNPDAELELLWHRDGTTDENRETILADLSRVTAGADLIVSPWRGDGHRDHRVIGELCAALGVPIVEYPIWAWHWGSPASVPTERFTALPVGDKLAAITAHATQVLGLAGEVVLRPDFIDHFTTGTEVFIVPQSSLGADYFDALYERHDDPWEFESRWYERRKRAITVASLPSERYGRALEIGCSIGVLSAALAEHCDDLLAVDLSRAAIETARSRDIENARFEVMDVAAGLPDGTFDLIVLSEVGYYLVLDDLTALLAQVTEHLSEGGVLVACHWRHPVADYPISGDEVHAAITLPRIVHHEEEDFLLEVFSRDTRSVAQREELV